MKKYLAIVFVVALLLCMAAVPAFADGSIEISVETDVSKDAIISGEPFTATIWVTNSSATPLGGLDLTIVADGFDIIGDPSINNDSSLNIDSSSANGALLGIVFKEAGCAVEHWWVATVQMTAKSLGNKTIGATVRDVYDASYGNVTGVGQTFSTSVTVTHTQHDWVEGADSEGWIVTKVPTCTETGLKEQKCETEGCPLHDNPKKEEIGKVPHKSDDIWHDDDPAGHYHLCTVCNTKLDQTPHSGKAVPNEDGTTHSVKCDVCEYASDAENHSSSAAPKSDGTNHWYVCDACEAVFGKEAHAFGDWVQGETTHYKECEVCKVKSEEAEHTWKTTGETTATCTKPGDSDVVCTTCGKESKIEGKPLGHLYEGEPVVVPATCEKDGTSTRTCVRPGCDGGENGNPYVDVKVLPALGHDFTGEVYTEKCVDPTYLTAGVKATKCVRFDECGEWEEEPIPKLELTDDVLNVTVDPVPEFVNNKAVMDELQDTIESAVKDIADGNEPATVKTAFIEAVRDSLSKNEGDVSVAVTVSLEEVTDPAALPERLQKDAEGMNFEAGWKLGITALVDGTTTVEDAMDALPVPAEYALSKPEYAAPIGVQFEDVSAGCFGYPAAKKDNAFLVEAQSAGYYALFTTGDLSSDYVCYNFTDVYAYTGSAIEPKVVVTINSGETVDPKYYNVEYKDNTNVTDKAQIIITLTDEGKAAGFTLEEAMTFTFSITPAPATATPKPTGSGSTTNNNGNAPDTGDETNVALYAVVLAVCTAALVLVVTLRKKSSR